MPIMGTCETCGGETMDYCCVACMSLRIRELEEENEQLKRKVAICDENQDLLDRTLRAFEKELTALDKQLDKPSDPG